MVEYLPNKLYADTIYSQAMSTWFDQSNNANKLRQSYLKGFLDISGGAVNIRADNSLNFYTADEDSVSKVAIDA